MTQNKLKRKCDRCGKETNRLRDIIVYRHFLGISIPNTDSLCKECFCKAYPERGKIEWDWYFYAEENNDDPE